MDPRLRLHPGERAQHAGERAGRLTRRDRGVDGPGFGARAIGGDVGEGVCEAGQ